MLSLKEKLRQQACIGTLLGIDSPDVAEILALAGFDWLFVDLEHSTLSPAMLKDIIRAVRSVRKDCAVIARVPLNDTIWLKRVLDAGCDGVIIPQVNSAHEAKIAIDNTKYRPLGTRGIGAGRAHGFGHTFKEYIEAANDSVLTILQIESIDGAEHIDDILKVKGIDAIFVGPYDLSDSMGLRSQVDHAKVKETIVKIQSACEKRSVPTGIFVAGHEAAKMWIAEGFRLVTMGTDTSYVAQAAKEALKAVRS